MRSHSIVGVNCRSDQHHPRWLNIYVSWLTYIQRMCLNALYSIVPFYVVSTPEHGWKATDLALIFSISNVGSIVGSQILLILLQLFPKKSRTSLFICHLSQFIAAIVAFVIVCDTFVQFNYYLFIFAGFLIGYTGDLTIIQSYVAEIEHSSNLMNNISQILLFSIIVDQLLLPTIYDKFGFNILCIVLLGLLTGSFFIYFHLWIKIKALTGDETTTVEPVMTFRRSSIIDVAAVRAFSRRKNIISPSLFVLVFLAFIINFCMELYAVSFPIIFFEDFKISASMSGYLASIASAIAFTALLISNKVSTIYIRWQYPYNMLFFMVLYMSGYLAYIIFYQKWIAYSFHLLIYYNSLPRTVISLEMVTRLELCPDNRVFQNITGISGFLTNLAYLIASAVGPLLVSIWPRIPFIISFALTSFLFFVMVIVHCRRTQFLANIYDAEQVSENYLDMEKLYYRTEQRKQRAIEWKNENDTTEEMLTEESNTSENVCINK
eukprot:143993_1